MSPVLLKIGQTLLGVGASMFWQLLSEGLVKGLVVRGLESLAKRTKTDQDDKILAEVKKAWGID